MHRRPSGFVIDVAVRHELEGWRSAHGRRVDGTFESDERVIAAQAVVEYSEAGARRLGERYWRAVLRSSGGIVRPRDTDAGMELRLLGSGMCLLRFGRAEVHHDTAAVACRYRILGGLLARRAGGSITLEQRGGRQPELRATVRGFAPRIATGARVPRWRAAVYERVQHRLHVAISRRYFETLIRQARS
jgi:hypothetical protein